MIETSELTKLYYSIGEVSQMFDVNTSLIRFWETEFASIKPKKNKKGNRLFSPESIIEIQRIYQLVKIDGYTLEGARKELKSKPKKSTDSSASSNSIDKSYLITRLESIKEKLIALK